MRNFFLFAQHFLQYSLSIRNQNAKNLLFVKKIFAKIVKNRQKSLFFEKWLKTRFFIKKPLFQAPSKIGQNFKVAEEQCFEREKSHFR